MGMTKASRVRSVSRIIQILAISFFCFTTSLFAEENVKIKVLAVNPSDSKSINSTVLQILPPEVTPEDVLDKGGMEVKFDSQKKVYFLMQTVELKPKETRTFEVTVKNVWTIKSEDIEETRNQLSQNLASLKGTKFEESAKLIYEKAEEALTQIEESQGKRIAMTQRMELYRANARLLSSIQHNSFSMESMRQLEQEKKTGVREAKFLITAINPADEERKMTVRAILPKEVKAEDVLDKGDFQLLYDDVKQAYALEKEDTLAGKVNKKYQITLRDIWYIPQEELDFLRDETEKLLKLFVKTSYEAYSVKRGNFVFETLTSISTLQSEVEGSNTLEDRIRANVLNSERMELVKKRIKQLQDLLPEIPLKPDQDELQQALQNFVKKVKETKDLVLMSMGFQQNRPITWWIFFGIVIFLAVLSLIFYLVWLKKLQENKWVKSTKTEKQTKKEEQPKEEARQKETVE